MDDFTFDPPLNAFFQSNSGAGSRVTSADEAKKRQLTVVKGEKKLLRKFHKRIPSGPLKSAESNGQQVAFAFRKYPTGQKIFLKLNYPKPSKSELRLYFNKDAFSPNEGDLWFLFERGQELWIGSMHDSELEAAKNGSHIDVQNGFDHVAEEEYQTYLNTNSPRTIFSTSIKYKRDPNVGRKAIQNSQYKCELMPNLNTFVSKATSKPYLEAHHFIPMMEQRNFMKSLDVVENICILHPYSHRMLHHANYVDIEPYLIQLAKPRQQFLDQLGLTVDSVLHYYGAP